MHKIEYFLAPPLPRNRPPPCHNPHPPRPHHYLCPRPHLHPHPRSPYLPRHLPDPTRSREESRRFQMNR
ncbi:hypothetical protein A2U01_0060136, partial [Trifolium medium]|nr:hypothetical protein [Trifolium medium]